MPDRTDRWLDVRALWNDFDPIGVRSRSHGLEDEYDSYIDPTIRLLSRGSSREELNTYVAEVVFREMGLPETSELSDARSRFVERLLSWFASQRPGASA